MWCYRISYSYVITQKCVDFGPKKAGGLLVTVFVFVYFKESEGLNFVSFRMAVFSTLFSNFVDKV